MNTALQFGILAIAYTIFTKGKALRTLNFYPASVRDIRFDGLTPVMTIGLAIQNTSGQRMVLRSLAGNLYANDYLIGNVSSFMPMTITPNSQSVLTMNVRLSVIGIVQDIINAFNGNGLKQDVKFSATANIDHYQLPIEITYKIG